MKYVMLAFAFALIGAQSAVADEVCRPCPFDCSMIGIDQRHCSYRDRRYGACCVDLDNDGKELLQSYDRHYGRRPDWDDHRSDHRDDRYDDRRDDWRDGRPDYRDHDDSRHGNYGYQPPPRRRDPGAYDDRNGYQPGDCPVGFHVNERNCNDEERRKGCMDKRSPSGQICVGWRGGQR